MTLSKPKLPILQRGHSLTHKLLAAYVPYEGANEFLHNVSRNRWHGDTWIGSPTWNQGPWGPVLNMVGSGNAITVDGNIVNGLGQVSVFARINVGATDEYRAWFGTWDQTQILCRKNRSSNGYYLQTFLVTNNGQAGGNHDVLVPISEWCSVAHVYDGVEISAYLNGVLAPTTLAQTGTIITRSADSNIGWDGRTSDETIHGYLDCLLVYGRALLPTEVRSLDRDPYVMFRSRSHLSVAATQVIASTTTISLSWSDNAEHEDGFSIERDTDGGGFVEIDTAAADATGYNDTGVEVGHTYTYRVKATSTALGDSEYSNEAEVTV